MAGFNYHHLRYFWAVAHDGNLTRTAERLNLSQSALSIQIRKLEQRLGQDLFERRGRQLFLTEAGRIALDHADTIFSAGEDLIATLRQAGGARKALRIGSLATLSRNFQIAFLRPVLGRADVEVVLRSGSMEELISELGALNLDVVLGNLPAPRDAASRLRSHLIAEQLVGLVGLAGLFDPETPFEDLVREVPVILPSLGNAARVGFDALADKLEVTPQIVAEVDDMAMMRLLAREGIGMALVPPIVVRDELASGKLIEARDHPRISEQFFAIVPERRFPNPLLADLLSQDFRDLVPD